MKLSTLNFRFHNLTPLLVIGEGLFSKYSDSCDIKSPFPTVGEGAFSFPPFLVGLDPYFGGIFAVVLHGVVFLKILPDGCMEVLQLLVREAKHTVNGCALYVTPWVPYPTIEFENVGVDTFVVFDYYFEVFRLDFLKLSGEVCDHFPVPLPFRSGNGEVSLPFPYLLPNIVSSAFVSF